MRRSGSKLFPVIITVLIIMIIIYLISNAKQPYVECSKTKTDDLGITLKENLITTLDSNKISEMKFTRTIILPQKYLGSDRYLNEIKFALEKSYEYLGDEVVKVTKDSDRIIVDIEIEHLETIILNNIEFFDNGGLEVKINPNTKSSGVITLSIKDKYSEGELMSRLKNNGYSCK